MPEKKNKIFCRACNSESWLKRKPVYDDNFKKTGEELSCGACGHIYASENEVPWLGNTGPVIFTEADKGPKIEIFDDDEKARNCRHCEHYIVNPFTQRCGLHFRRVEATDVCDDFSPSKPGDITES